MATIHEIAPDVFRICVWESQFNIQFNHFLVRDEEPLLFHTGYNRMFSEVREAAGKLMDPAKIRWIGFSHFESDECGSLNKWMQLAPQATPVCTPLASALNVDDFAIRPSRPMPDDQTLSTGKYRFRFLSTAHLPHGWDAGVLLEETQGTLFCSDLLFQFGEQKPISNSSVLDAVRESLLNMEASAFAYSIPYSQTTARILAKLAATKPRTLAMMHGSSFTGDCAGALSDYGSVLREVLGKSD